MTDALRRAALMDAYSGPSWRTRVNNMSETQILAIYYRFKKEGKIK